MLPVQHCSSALQAEHDVLAFVPIGFQPGTPRACDAGATADEAGDLNTDPVGEAGNGDGFQKAKKKGKQKTKKRGRQFLWRMWVKGVPGANADVQAALQPDAPRELWALNRYQRLELVNG